MSRARALLALVVALGGVASCAGPGVGGAATSTGAGDAPDPRTLTVFAAASLTSVFTDLADEFEDANPGVTVRLSLAGSQDLADQVVGGAVADVFASANEAQMGVVVAAGRAVGEPALFATNELMIAVPPGNPGAVASFAGLAEPGLAVVVCAEAVPCGAATAGLEARTGVELTPVSEEQSVTDVLAKVAAGEADAGVVYRTDVRAAGDAVLGVELGVEDPPVNRYPIAVLADGPQPALAREFVDLVLGERGQAALAGAGFGPAPDGGP